MLPSHQQNIDTTFLTQLNAKTDIDEHVNRITDATRPKPESRQTDRRSSSANGFLKTPISENADPNAYALVPMQPQASHFYPISGHSRDDSPER